MAKKTMEETVARLIRNDVRRKMATVRPASQLAKHVPLVPYEVQPLTVEAGKLPPVEANVSVNFVSSKNQRADMVPKCVKAFHPTGLAAIFEGFTEKEMDELRELEPQLLKWIDTNNKNAARFFADPVGALDLAGINISKALRKKVSRIRTKSSFARAELPHATIQSIKVGISSIKKIQKRSI